MPRYLINHWKLFDCCLRLSTHFINLHISISSVFRLSTFAISSRTPVISFCPKFRDSSPSWSSARSSQFQYLCDLELSPYSRLELSIDSRFFSNEPRPKGLYFTQVLSSAGISKGGTASGLLKSSASRCAATSFGDGSPAIYNQDLKITAKISIVSQTCH